MDELDLDEIPERGLSWKELLGDDYDECFGEMSFGVPAHRTIDSFSEAHRDVIREKCMKQGKEDPWAYRARKDAELRDRNRRTINSAEKQEIKEANTELPPVKKASLEFKISLQQARMASGLKQKDLATKVKVTANVISDWESGRSVPTGAQRAALNRILKTVLPK